MFEDPMTAPLYNGLYGFPNGAQNDIFVTNAQSPPASQNQTKRNDELVDRNAEIKEAVAARNVRNAGQHGKNKRKAPGHRAF
jgi:hypothetical protein